MPIYPAGILPYGSDDDSIILQTPLTSAAQTTADGGAVQALATFDSVRGMLSGGPGAGVQFITLSGYQSLDNAGQMSFEIPTESIGRLDADAPKSNGYARDATSYIMSWGTGTTNRTGLIFMESAERLKYLMNTTDTTVFAVNHTAAGSEFSRITCSWFGSRYDIYVDSVLRASMTRGTKTANLFNTIHVGGDRLLLTPWTHHIRNLQISSRPVAWASHPKLRKVVLFGDSYALQGAFELTGLRLNASMSSIVDRYLKERGFRANIVNDGTTGAYVSDTAGTPLLTTLTPMIATHPSYVLYRGGTNDCQDSSLPADFESSIKGHMTAILADAGVEKVIVGTVPTVRFDALSSGANFEANVSQANAIINALPAWWDAANPANTDKISVVDIFTAFGGEDASANLYVDANVHPAGTGHVIMGLEYAKALYSDL